MTNLLKPYAKNIVDKPAHSHSLIGAFIIHYQYSVIHITAVPKTSRTPASRPDRIFPGHKPRKTGFLMKLIIYFWTLGHKTPLGYGHIWAASRQNQQNDCAPSENSDQPGHPPSLIRVLAVRSVSSYGPKLSSCGQRRLIRVGGCPGWSESSLGAHAILLVLSWGGSYVFNH